MRAEYCSAFYFVITTMTTVGYGDMPIGTSTEQLFCICLMMSGVFIFSLVSGSLASILASFDQTNADLAAKVLFLNRLQQQYALPKNICTEINKALVYDSQMDASGLADFIETLPPQLRIAVSIHIY
jgi:hypothetical protein